MCNAGFGLSATLPLLIYEILPWCVPRFILQILYIDNCCLSYAIWTFKWPTPTRTSSSGRSARGRVADQGMGKAREPVVQYGRRRAQNPPRTAYSTEQPATVQEQPATMWEQPATVRAIRLAIGLAIGRKGSLCRRAVGRAVPMRPHIPLLPTTKSCHRSRIRPSAKKKKLSVALFQSRSIGRRGGSSVYDWRPFAS